MNPFTNGPSQVAPAHDGPATGHSGQLATRKRQGRRWAAGVAVTAPLALAGCNFYPSYGAAKGATTQGQETFKLYSGMMTAGIIVFGFVFLLIVWTVFRYRRSSEEIPRQFHENVPVEILYTGIPIIIVFVLFFFTVLTENNVDATVPANATVTSTGTPVVEVKVTAFQWGWRFDYPDLNVGVAGEVTNGPDGHGPQMVVPVGQTVQITLVSNDVIHGFYLRDFNFSRYALPGVVNYFDFNVVHAGTYFGQCTQICGLYHSEMLFSVRAVSPAQFRQWASAEVAGGHTLQRSGNPAVNTPPLETHVTPSNALGAPGSEKASL